MLKNLERASAPSRKGGPFESVCDFCEELRGSPDSTFHSLYGRTLNSRVVSSNDHAVLLPSLGQILAGMWLALPYRHVNRLADLSEDELDSVLELASAAVENDGPHWVMFEHGAIPGRGVNCGIYHAHLHIVATPRTIKHSELFTGGQECASLRRALHTLSDSPNYVVVVDSDGVVSARSIKESEQSDFPSQYFRQRIASLCGSDASWDWRSYSHVEPALLDLIEECATVRFFNTDNGSPSEG